MSLIILILFIAATGFVLKTVADRRNASFALLTVVFWAGVVSAFLWLGFYLRFRL